MREITQSGEVRCRMVRRGGGLEHRLQEVDPMQTLRASAIAVPFVILAVAIAVLSAVVS
jgi:hypothetical protein